MLKVQVFEGLCNRINAIASAMATGRPAWLHWAVNKHCPVRFEEVFTESFDMEIVNEKVDEYSYIRHNRNRLCWFYPQNVINLPFNIFQGRMQSAYKRILAALTVELWMKPAMPALGLSYRHHMDDIDSFGHYWECVKEHINVLRPREVHVATDSMEMKEALRKFLNAVGNVVVTNDCTLMGHDMDRTPDNVLGMCADLKSLSNCSLVITNSTRSTVTDSIGVPVFRTFDDKVHRYGGRDHLFSLGD